MSSVRLQKLPTIDFSKENLKPGTQEWNNTSKEVMCALEEYGCFLASYEKISSQIHNAVFGALEELFDLPVQTKVQNITVGTTLGYMGQISVAPLYESMGIDEGNISEAIQSFTNVMWPNGNESFSEKLLFYTKLAAELEEIVVKMVFESYGTEMYYDSHLQSVWYRSRLTKYREAKANEPKLGNPSHTDPSFMATIHQNHVNGLEIKAKDGEWFSVDLSPSTIVVMAGDAMMAWSNNRIKSTPHRVIKKGKGPRYSIAQFSLLEGTVQTPKELVDDDHPLQFKPFDHLEFLKYYSDESRRGEHTIKSYCGL